MTTQSPYPKRADLAALNDGDDIVIIPADVHTAAKRGFVRTFTQSLAGSFVGLGGVAFAFTTDWLIALLVGLIGAVVTALIAGAQSYLDILSKGIPQAYQDEILTDPVGPLTAGDDEDWGRWPS